LRGINTSDLTHLLSSRLSDSSVVPPVAALGQVAAVDKSVAVVRGGGGLSDMFNTTAYGKRQLNIYRQLNI